MNLKATLILLVLFALAVAAYLLTRGGAASQPPAKPGEAARDRLDTALLDPNWLGSELQGFTLRKDGRDVVTLEKQAGQWRITHPHAFPADGRAVDELLSLLASLTGVANTEQPGGALASRVLSLHTAEQHEAIRLNMQEHLGAGRGSVLVSGPDGSSVYRTEDTLHKLFESLDARVFFAKSLDAPLMATTDRVQFTHADRASLLVQQEGRWWIDLGEQRQRAWDKGETGRPGVGDYFELIDAIQIIEHQPYDPAAGLAPFGLDRPLIRVTLVPQGAPDSNTKEIRVGVPADPGDQTRYVSYGTAGDPRPAVFTVDSRFALPLGKNATDFRDPRVTDTAVALIGGIDLNAPDAEPSSIIFHGDEVGPRIHHGAVSAALSAKRCEDMLQRLTNARALAFIPIDPGWKPVLNVVIHPRLSDEPQAITVYSDPESSADQPTVLVQRSNETVSMRIDQSAVEGLIDPSQIGIAWPDG